MAYDLVIDGDTEYDLATIAGYKKLCNWAMNNGGPELKQFVSTNEITDIPSLRKEIILLLSRTDLTIPKGVRSTLDFMASVSLRMGNTAYVTDGFSDED